MVIISKGSLLRQVIFIKEQRNRLKLLIPYLYISKTKKAVFEGMVLNISGTFEKKKKSPLMIL